MAAVILEGVPRTIPDLLGVSSRPCAFAPSRPGAQQGPGRPRLVAGRAGSADGPRRDLGRCRHMGCMAFLLAMAGVVATLPARRLVAGGVRRGARPAAQPRGPGRYAPEVV